MIFLISSFGITDVVVCNQNNISLWIPANAGDAAAPNPNDLSTPLVNSVSMFLANGKLILSNGQRSLPGDSLYWKVLDIFIFDNFELIAELFAKVLLTFKICVSVSNIIFYQLNIQWYS